MSSARPGSGRRRFELRDASGVHVMTHVRVNRPDGDKSFIWERPDGRPGLGGVPAGELPLYGIDRLDGLMQRVVIVEGEKAAEALWSAGFAAVGTVTGASSIPSSGPLSELSGRTVVCWPDADEVGHRHMARIADALRSVAASVSLVDPPEGVPSGWDAADAVAEGREIAAILAAARPVSRPPVNAAGSLEAPTADKGPEAVITRLSEVAPEPLDWLWPGYIPAAMLTILDGDPGLGKSLLTLELAARVTHGRPLPADSWVATRAPRGVVLLSAEDDLAHTIRPRLDAAGADPDRVAVVVIRERDGMTREPAITAADLQAVERAIREVDAALLIIDPLVAYLSDDVNPNRDHDVRRALALLADLAERTGAAVLAVRHLRKAGADNPLYRGGGSIGIIGAARSGLLVARDPDDPSGLRRVLAVTKSNLGPLPPSLVFALETVPEAMQPHVAWQGESSRRAAELLATARPGEQSPLEDACDFLRELLSGGSMPATQVRAAAAAAGISARTLDRAKGRLRVRSVRPAGFTGPWHWALPGPYDATETRTSPGAGDGEVRQTLATYEATLDRAVRPDGEGAEPGWRCPTDRGTGHLPALRPDGAVYCGTCHP